MKALGVNDPISAKFPASYRSTSNEKPDVIARITGQARSLRARQQRSLLARVEKPAVPAHSTPFGSLPGRFHYLASLPRVSVWHSTAKYRSFWRGGSLVAAESGLRASLDFGAEGFA